MQPRNAVFDRRLEELRALARRAWAERDYSAHSALEHVEVEILEVRHRLSAAQRVLTGDALQFVKALLEEI